MITSMVDDFLKKNPSEEKAQKTKDEQDMRDCFPANVVTIVNAKKLFKPHLADMQKKMKDKKEDKEEEKKENKREENKEKKKEEVKDAPAQARPAGVK
jgi:DUF1680 family protein